MTLSKWLGDVALAVLLAVPTVALTRPQITGLPNRPSHSAARVQTAATDHSRLGQRFSLLG